MRRAAVYPSPTILHPHPHPRPPAFPTHAHSHAQVGQRKAQAAAQGERPFSKDAYFLGKVLWAKGYTELLDRLKEHTAATGQSIHVDVYGSGPDLKVRGGRGEGGGGGGAHYCEANRQAVWPQ